MIKRIRFATAAPGRTADECTTALRGSLDRALGAPKDVRPLRATLCRSLPDVIAGPVHDALSLEWFGDAAHLGCHDEWVAALGAPPLGPAENPTVVAEEMVLRGQDWLEQHWRHEGRAFKHMAIARRADGLTPAEFSERWKSRAGTVRAPGAAAAVAIPDDARGLAYVQNHPVPRQAGGWAYDAVNEVYFADVEGLRRRIAWFDETLAGRTEDDLVRESRFLAVEEVVIGPR